MRKLILAATLLALAGCTDKKPELAKDVEAYGFDNVVIGDWAPWGCSEDDTYEYRFTAINPAGRPINGIICKGWVKGATVRIG